MSKIGMIQKKIFKYGLLTLCLLGMLLSGCSGSTGQTQTVQSAAQPEAHADGFPAGQTNAPKTDTAESPPGISQIGTAAGSSGETLLTLPGQEGSVLVFASDYQHRDGWEDPPVTLNRILDAVYGADIQPDNYIFCGDYTALDGRNNYNADPHDAIEEIKGICAAHDASLAPEQMIFVQGNHDEKIADISESGLHEYEDYLVYVLNTEEDYPWGQGKMSQETTVIRGAMRLKKCLDQLTKRREKRPIFLAAHVPLHFTGRTSPLQGTGDNLYARDLFKVINAAGEHLNLVYLFGHNHSRGWDSYLGGSCVFRSPGDWLLIPQVEEEETVTSRYTQEKLTFTYLNAGYVGYFSSEGKEDQLESTLTCTVCEIKGNDLTFSRYSKDGIYLLNGEGRCNPAKDDSKLIPREYYGEPLESPYTVEGNQESRRTIKAA